MCEEVKPPSVFLPLASLYEGMELMMACRYFSCSKLVESVCDGPETKHTRLLLVLYLVVRELGLIVKIKLHSTNTPKVMGSIPRELINW